MTVTSKEPRVHTLEDVAEGVLNGMLCTYEPPDPRRWGHQPGILRGRKQHPKNRHRRRHIRWKDERPTTPKIMQWHDTVQRACVDASVELGCTPMMDTETALAKARSKSPRTQLDLVFDDEGFPKYRNAGLAKEPPPDLPVAPPPSRREPFFPQLCGIPLGCGEDVPPQDISLVDEFQYEPPIEAQEPSRRHRPIEGQVVPIVEEYVSASEEEEGGADWASASMNSTSSLLYRVFAYRKKKDTGGKMGTLEEREEDSVDSGILKSRTKKGTRKLEKLTKRRGSKSSDWDETVPVVPLEPKSASKLESRRRRQSPLKRRSRSVSPSRRSRSASPGRKSPARRRLSPRRRSKSPASQRIPEKSSGDSSSQHRVGPILHPQTNHLPLDQSDRQSHIGAFREGSMYGVPPPQAWNTVVPVQQSGHPPSVPPHAYTMYPPQVEPAMYPYDGSPMRPMQRNARRRSRSRSPGRARERDRSQSPHSPHMAQHQQQLPQQYYGYYHPADGSLPRYFDPTNPQAFAVAPPLPLQHYAQQQVPMEINPPNPMAVLKENSSDLTWEDRTRLAWDQIRSGVAALTLDAKHKADKKADTTTGASNSLPNQAQTNPEPPPTMQSPSLPRDQQEYHSRKVTFGKPQQLVYYDTIDENRSERSCSTKGSSRSKKTKLRLRGTKAIGGALDRMKKTLSRKHRLRYSDEGSVVSSEGGHVSASHTWGSDPIEMYRRKELSSTQPEEVDEYGHLYSSDYESSPKRIDRRNSNPLSDKN